MSNSELKKKSMADYKILRTVGEGSFGEVFLVKDRQTKEHCVIKNINKKFLFSSKKQHWVFIEKMFLQYFNFPFMVKLIDTFQDSESIYFCLENIPNGELNKFVDEHFPLKTSYLRQIAAEIVIILETMHANGIVHRDFKPENLLLDDNYHLKIIDFGTAALIPIENVNEKIYEVYLNIKEKFDPNFDKTACLKMKAESHKHVINFSELNRSSLDYEELKKFDRKRNHTFVGTAYYVSPEMIVENAVTNFGSDFWAFGILLHRLASGLFPFESSNEYFVFEAIKSGKVSLNEKINDDLKSLILDLLKHDPKIRLGNGPVGSEFDMKALKSHAFFKDVDWKTVFEGKSILESLVLENEGSSNENSLNLDEDKIEMSKRDLILLEGEITLIKRHSEKQDFKMSLFSNGDICLKPVGALGRKMSIFLGENTFCGLDNDNEFHISTADGITKVELKEKEAKKWVDKINEIIEKL